MTLETEKYTDTPFKEVAIGLYRQAWHDCLRYCCNEKLTKTKREIADELAVKYPACDHAQELLKACKHSLSVLNMLAYTTDLVHRTLPVREELETAISSAKGKQNV